MRHRRRTYAATRRQPSAGYEAARRHIEEARAFSDEIGGNDSDVKSYFFGLPWTELDALFRAYGAKYNASAEAYARETYPKWKDGKTQMSGLVAKRLFDLLPSRMPARIKFQLAENLWKHFGPGQIIDFTLGPTTDAAQAISFIHGKVDTAIQDYTIPENIRKRFTWLSGGDVAAKEGLLNHFRKQERDLAIAVLNRQLPVLQRQMREYAPTTGSLKTTVNIHRISVNLWIDARLEATCREGTPQAKSSMKNSVGADNSIGLWITIIGVAIAAIMMLMGRH